MPSAFTCRVVHLGTLEYRHAWDIQLRLAGDVHEGVQPNTLLLLEHPPVYTWGRLSKPEHILLPPEELEKRGISVYEADRGGQVTFHGPGQLVAYPVVDLRNWGGPVKYVRTLEQVIIGTLADLGINAGTIDGITGVWAEDAKISAIGVKISRGVAYHGLAINVNTDLTYFDYIVPCGIYDRPVTSMAKLLGEPVDMAAVRYSLAYRFGQAMGFKMFEAEGAALSLPG
ncbi:MAG: lipoyl(octanoyl) transferase LipB [Chloroflexi bacterium]|nr:lipoyl(octanoyl) transferase LipB [Chloroflexota bacterium]